jgi:hypothetical protein
VFGATGSIEFYFQPNAPTGVIQIGALWVESDTGSKFFYIDDGDTKQWVEFEGVAPEPVITLDGGTPSSITVYGDIDGGNP